MMIMTQVFSLQTLDSVFFPRKINITFEELVHVTSPESPSPSPRLDRSRVQSLKHKQETVLSSHIAHAWTDPFN